MPGEVLGCQAIFPRHTPNLEKMYLLIAMRFLTVANACTRGCELDVASFKHFRVAHGIMT